MIRRASVLSVLFVLSFTGCTTVTPKPVASREASFDGNEQNSGIIAYVPGHGLQITAHKRDAYNLLIDNYGRAFTPPLIRDAGLAPLADGTWLLDLEHSQRLLEMIAWQRMGRAPAK